MMKSKYRILYRDDCVGMSSEPQIILHKVVFSYPSIIFGMFYYNDVKILNPLSKILFHWDLSNIFCSPLASIIPVLETEHKEIPLALLCLVELPGKIENFSYLYV